MYEVHSRIQLSIERYNILKVNLCQKHVNTLNCNTYNMDNYINWLVYSFNDKIC